MSKNQKKPLKNDNHQNTSPITPIMKKPQYLNHSAEPIQFKKPQYVMENFIPTQISSSNSDDK